MAIRRLVNMLGQIDRSPQGARNDRQMSILSDKRDALAFFETGTVIATQQSTVTVTWRSQTLQARLSTDEPLVAGQTVWIMQADDKSIVVLGSVK